jgi:ubiquinone/menaquinone biosynthesis C-methylase UbiE
MTSASRVAWTRQAGRVPEFPPRGEEQKSVSELSFFAKPMTDVSGRDLFSLGHLRRRFIWHRPGGGVPEPGARGATTMEITRFGTKRTGAVTSAPAWLPRHGSNRSGHSGSNARPARRERLPVGETPQYKMWIRLDRLWLTGSLALVSLVGVALSVLSPWFVLFVIPFCVFLYISVIVGMCAYRFSPMGGDFQRRIHELVTSLVKTQEGVCRKVLDLGCGNASLTVKMARQFPAEKVYGVDYWGADWSYSKQQCERNAQLEGVGDRVVFDKQSASSLAFPDGDFDVVVSCLTFHEVNDAPDKLTALREALRVLRRGGQFVFLDLFGDNHFFESPEKVRQILAESGADVACLKKLDQYMSLPFPLMHKKAVGHAMVVAGNKL